MESIMITYLYTGLFIALISDKVIKKHNTAQIAISITLWPATLILMIYRLSK